MTLRCRPGDLVWIVRHPDAANYGRVVRVIAPADPGMWVVAPVSGQLSSRYGPIRVGLARDVDLMPLAQAEPPAPDFPIPNRRRGPT